MCRECGGSSICVHNHQKNKCRKCQKLNMCGHKIARKSCAECKALRDLGPEALAIKVHELLALLDDEHTVAHIPLANDDLPIFVNFSKCACVHSYLAV